jgi:ligand-binding SRPBCC domain-containing protein
MPTFRISPPTASDATRVSRIELVTRIAAPADRCFDLSLSVEMHLASTEGTSERAVAGVTSGVLGLGNEVTWEARHFGRRRTLTMRITAYDRPKTFRDELVSGPFRRLVHDHFFDSVGERTEMRDVFEVHTWVPPFDALVLAPYFRRFLRRRNDAIRRIAESDEWQRYVDR